MLRMRCSSYSDMGIGERQRDTPVERQDGNDQEVPQGETNSHQ
jgi:hypothetical protein